MKMKEVFKIEDVLNIEELQSEYDLQKASQLDRKLRLEIKNNPRLKQIRKKLRDLIHNYEKKYWSDFENISEEQVDESDNAENAILLEEEFIQKRKRIIKDKLKDFDLNQQELGVLLGHSKSYISELMNGISQFTIKDLVIIHKMFDIDLNNLVPTIIKSETKEKINQTINKMNNPKLDLLKQ
jgi:plasmid maintenance system antidote protein VapI